MGFALPALTALTLLAKPGRCAPPWGASRTLRRRPVLSVKPSLNRAMPRLCPATAVELTF